MSGGLFEETSDSEETTRKRERRLLTERSIHDRPLKELNISSGKCYLRNRRRSRLGSKKFRFPFSGAIYFSLSPVAEV